jgi:hypothetical protein
LKTGVIKILRSFHAQFHPDDITFSKQRKVAYGIYDRDVSTRCTPKVERSRTPPVWGHYREGTYGQQPNSKIYEKLMDHGAIDEDTKFIDLGSGTMMWCLHMALKTGKPVIG